MNSYWTLILAVVVGSLLGQIVSTYIFYRFYAGSRLDKWVNDKLDKWGIF